MQPIEFGPGTSKWNWSNQPPQVLNPFGTIQGGYIAVFVDEVLSTAIGSVLDEGEWATTAEMKLSYLRSLSPGEIEGSGRVVRRTRSIAFVEATIGPIDAPCIIASSTWAISRK